MSSSTMTSIRQAHKDLTRERILDAALETIAEDSDAPLTMASVAKRAGVTERTVYRHFATREALVRAVWPRMQAQVQSLGFPASAEALIRTPMRLFPKFDEREALVRASVYSEAGREVRLSSNPERQAAMLACVDDGLRSLGPAAKRRRAAVVQLINSAYGWSVLKDFWGLDGKEAGQAAAEAIAVLLGRRTPHSEEAISDEEENTK
jgi:AcrR family transcriptional regulator